MAEVLIKVGDQSPHPAHFKHGDILYIAEDGQGWGREECLETWISEGRDLKDWQPRFLIVKVPDAAIADLQHLVMPPTDDPDGPKRVHTFDHGKHGTDLTKSGTSHLAKADFLALVAKK